ncbi:MAG: GNAT family N-acetyltransferase [Betaproteobacteria bacterium]
MTPIITTDPARIDLDAVHAFLSQQAHWSRGIPRRTVQRAISNSLCFAALEHHGPGAPLAGFARVVTDRATFAYLCDVFVLPAGRGRGIARALLAAIDAHADLQGLRRVVLFTRDAHGLYARHGFAPLTNPERGMERLHAGLYTRANDFPQGPAA